MSITTPPTIRRRSTLAALALPVVLALVSIPAAPVEAHASMVSVSPAANTSVASAPSNVMVSFNEQVAATAKTMQLLNGSGVVVATKFASVSGGSGYRLTPTTRLANGGYTLRWSVVSADGHTVTGAASFWVGSLPRSGSALRTTLKDTQGSQVVSFSSNRTGRVTFPVLAGTKAVEFRHAKIGAAIHASVTGGTATVVLPVAGKWSTTMIVSVSEFSERRLLGSFTLR